MNVLKIHVGLHAGLVRKEAARRRYGWVTGAFSVAESIQTALANAPEGTIVWLAGGDANKCLRGIVRTSIHRNLQPYIDPRDITTGDKHHDTIEDRIQAVINGFTPEEGKKITFASRPKR